MFDLNLQHDAIGCRVSGDYVGVVVKAKTALLSKAMLLIFVPCAFTLLKVF